MRVARARARAFTGDVGNVPPTGKPGQQALAEVLGAPTVMMISVMISMMISVMISVGPGWGYLPAC